MPCVSRIRRGGIITRSIRLREVFLRIMARSSLFVDVFCFFFCLFLVIYLSAGFPTRRSWGWKSHLPPIRTILLLPTLRECENKPLPIINEAEACQRWVDGDEPTASIRFIPSHHPNTDSPQPCLLSPFHSEDLDIDMQRAGRYTASRAPISFQP